MTETFSRLAKVWPAPMGTGTVHARNPDDQHHGLCGVRVTLQALPDDIRIGCRKCWTLRTYRDMLAARRAES